MRDIIVRIPNKQFKHFVEDKLTSDVAFWRFSRKPKQLEIGDYIFFTVPEGVKYAGKIFKFINGEDMIEELGLGIIGDTGNVNALVEGKKILDLGNPVTEINYAQQGFKYCTESEQQLLRQKVQMSQQLREYDSSVN